MSATSPTLLEQLERVAWFSHVGAPIADSAVPRACTWAEAMTWFNSGYLEMKGYEAAFAMQDQVALVVQDGDRLWEEALARIEQPCIALTKQKAAQVAKERGLAVTFEMIVSHDVIHACLEREFATVVESGFFSKKAGWYLRGHLPCGLTSDDELIVF